MMEVFLEDCLLGEISVGDVSVSPITVLLKAET